MYQNKKISIFNIFEVLKRYKYYLYSKLITENNYTELKKVFNNKLYNKNMKLKFQAFIQIKLLNLLIIILLKFLDFKVNIHINF